MREEARLDGIQVIRTSPGPGGIGTDRAVAAYRVLAAVERAFRTVRSHPGIRPVHVHGTDHVRAHVFPCMLAYHLKWHMRLSLAPLPFGEGDREDARARRRTPGGPAQIPDSASARPAAKPRLTGFRCTESRPCPTTCPPSCGR